MLENRLTDATTNFYNEVPTDSKTLEDVVVRKALSKEEFQRKLSMCVNKLSELKSKGDEIAESSFKDPMV